MSEEKNTRQINREVSEAQLEKLKLEIKELKNKKEKKTLSEKITPYIGLISVALATLGFLFGIYQFQRQLAAQNNQLIAEQEKSRLNQERELSEKIENHLSSDIEKILLFTKDEKMSAAHMRYLFEDLKTYIKLKARTAENPDKEVRKLTSAVSDKLIYEAENDCNFENHKDVLFLRTVLRGWEDFSEALKENEQKNSFILDGLRDALESFYSKDPKVVGTMIYDDLHGEFNYSPDYGKLTSTEIVHLQDLLNTIKGTFKLLSDENNKKYAILGFQAATCNRNLTKQILGMDYEPKDYGELRACVK